MVLLLLDCDANIEHQDIHENTASNVPFKFDNIHVTCFSIERGANIEQQNYQGALIVAAMDSHVNLASLLLDHNCSERCSQKNSY
jgi:ankyrin repeat protein